MPVSCQDLDTFEEEDRSHIQAVTEPEDDLLLEKVKSSTSVRQESSLT